MRRGILGAAAAASGYVYYKKRTDEGFSRALRLYSVGGPVVAAYRFEEWKQKSSLSPFKMSEEEKSAAWKALDEKHAERIVQLLDELQGMYTKYGQTCAGMSNTFSPLWIEKLRKLEDGVTPRSTKVVMQTIEEEFGKPASEIFSEFDDVPLGSASIGQVHRAVVRATGKEVAVKVQYPESQRLFAEDMKTIRSFFTIAAPEQLIILNEMERSANREFDYAVEASNLETVGGNMAAAGFCPKYAAVPQPLPQLTTRRVLTMELFRGPKLMDGIDAYASILAEQEGLTLEAFKAKMKDKITKEGIKDSYEGPSASTIQAYTAGLRLRAWTLNLGIAAYNSIAGGLLGYDRCEYYAAPTLPPNAPRIMDLLMRIHGHQLLVDGVFQADPHAGNFLLLPDDRIGLIDYGATKVLTRGERLISCILYAALARDDEKMLTDCVKFSGYKSKNMKNEVVMKLVKFGFDTWSNDLLKGKNVQQFVDDCYAEDPWEEAADNLVMAQFLSIRLRTVGMQMDHPVTCSKWWGPIAEAA